MHVEITFADGTVSRQPAEPVMCVVGRDLVPGWAVGPDDAGCDDWTDLLCEALANQHERCGSWHAVDDDEVSFTWRLVGTERDFCVDRLRHWIEEAGADAFHGLIAAAPGSPERVTAAREAGLDGPRSDRLEHDLWLMRRHVADLCEVMTDMLWAATAWTGP